MELGAARALAELLIDRHGLTGWRLVFDRAKTRAGVCRSARHEIGLSATLTLLHAEAEVRDTILHEIAHALVGPAHGHDAVWKAKAREVGCPAARCMPSDVPRAPAPWVGTCPAGHIAERHRRPQRLASCRQCSPDFDPSHLFDWLHHDRPVPMHSSYLAELRSLAPPEAEGGPVVTTRRLHVGERVRVTAPGRYHGIVGQVVKRGRTRYHVRVDSGVLTVPFPAVEPCLVRLDGVVRP